MLYRNLLMASGILLIIFGVVIYFNAIATQDAVVGDFDTSVIRLCLLLSSLFLVTAGISAILTGTFQYAKMLLFASKFGLKLVTFSLLLFIGLVFSSSSAAFAPFYETLTSSIELSAGMAGKIPLISVIVLACTVWIFYAGITIAENGGLLNGITITRIVSNLLFVFALLPVYYLLKKYAAPLGKIEVPASMTAFTLAAFIAWFMFIFIALRRTAKHSIAKLITITIFCIIFCGVYYYTVTYLYNTKSGLISDWKLTSLVMLILALLSVGYNGKYAHQIIGVSQCKYCGKKMKGWHTYCSTNCQNTAHLKAAINKVEKGGTLTFDDEEE